MVWVRFYINKAKKTVVIRVHCDSEPETEAIGAFLQRTNPIEKSLKELKL